MSTSEVTSVHNVPFASARRINQSVTAPWEKCALQWMARRSPKWVTSDRLTVLGFSAQICAGICYAWSRYNASALLLVSVFLVLNWLGDSMDGTLARVRGQQRPRYGFYVDHIVDVFGSIALMSGLAFSGLLHWQTAIAMLIAFLLLSSESYLATYTLSRFELSQGIFGPTEIRILLIVGNLAALHNPYATVFHHKILLFDLGGAIAAGCMVVLAIRTTVRHTRELYRQEPLP